MHRKWLLEKLHSYRPLTDAENNSFQILKAFIRQNDCCFNSDHPPKRGSEPDNQAGHVTGSAWLLSPDRKSVLLTYHRKLDKWLQLGGHSDNHPNVLETALREAKEESGIKVIAALHNEIFDLDVHLIPENRDRSAHLHYDVRFAFVSSSLNFVCSSESHELRWVPISEVPDYSEDDSVLRMCAKSQLMN